METFKHGLKNLDQLNYGDETMDKQATDYVKVISNLIEIHAPSIQRTVIPRPHAAWYTEELREAKQLRRKLGKTWRNGNQERKRQTKLPMSVLSSSPKTAYYSSKVQHCKKDNKALFKITDTLLKPSNKALPQTDNINSLPSQFLDFFENKIQKIRENFVPELPINPQQHNITLRASSCNNT